MTIKCNCPAYKFPHRPQAGACKKQWITRYFGGTSPTVCHECRFFLPPHEDNPEAECDILALHYMEARDCPAYDEFIRFQETSSKEKK